MSTLALLIGLATAAPFDRHAAAEAVTRGGPEGLVAETQLVELGRHGLWALSAALQRHDGIDARIRLVRALGGMTGPARPGAAWLLRKSLGSEEPSERRSAIEALGRLDPPRLGAILMTALDEPEPSVRPYLAAALARVGEELEPALLARRDAGSPGVREVVLRTLARTWEGDALTELLGRALLDPEASVRCAGIELVSALRDLTHVEALVTLSHHGDEVEARLSAEALGAFPGARARDLRLIEDPQAPLSAARVAFSRLRSTRRHALDLLLPALDALPEARRTELSSPLLQTPRPEEIEDLAGLLDHPDPARAALARSWLSAIGPAADEAVVLKLADARSTRASAFREYLASRPGGGVSARLLQRAREGELRERVEIVRAIGAAGTPSTRSHLVDLLADDAPEVRAAAAAAVADLEVAERPLLVLAVDTSASVRVAAIGALGSQLGQLSWSARFEALRDHDERVRIAAIRSLAGTRNPAALAQLENRVLLGTKAERVAAVAAIAESPTTEAAIKLVEMIAHSDPVIRNAALAYVDSL